MKEIVVFLFLSSFPMGLHAQSMVPHGTVLPVRLNSSISSETGKPGYTVTARLMQDVLLPGGSEIKKGAQIVGHLVKSAPSSGNSPAQVVLIFDSLRLADRTVPLRTSLRALASGLEVEDAQTPKAFDVATASTYATTVQVGGEVVYRGGGHVMRGEALVGEPVHGGVVSRTRANFERGCRGALDGNDQPQSLWVFSSDACGVYGLPHVTITSTGRNEHEGEIVLNSQNDRALRVRSGSGMLLRVL
jgi:hypothetical protein